MAATYLMQDSSFWLNRRQVEEAECNYYARLSGASTQATASNQGVQGQSGLASEIAKAREQIRQSLKDSAPQSADSGSLLCRLIQVEEENKELRKVTTSLQAAVKSLENRIKALEVSNTSGKPSAPPAASKPDSADVDSDDDDDDDFDLFGSEDEETKAENERIKEERVKAYTDKKAKKPQLIAKSNIILDVKPWDDETDMGEMERLVRSIEMDGLLWGAAKLVPVGYGIKKLQISTVVEDDKVSTDDLEDKITAFEDFVQSVDIAAFNKV